MIEKPVEDLSLEALKAGDPQALTQMVEQYSDSIYRVALRMLNDEAEAEDVLQETFIKAMRSLPNFEGRSTIATWLYRIAVNEALMTIRKRKPVVAVIEDEYNDEEDGGGMPNLQILDWCCLPEQEFETNETRATLNRAIRNLPESLRTVFVLRDVEGLSIRETAEALELTETNVKTRLLRARLKLREELTQFFGERMLEIKDDGKTTAL
jgi:RNA polymerase sigma-70 factor (ECF subfamily)